MISRVASHLYWMTRYLERAKYISQLLNVQVNQLSEDSSHTLSLGWFWIFKSFDISPPGGDLLGNNPQDSDDFCLADAYTLVDYLTFEREQPVSILSCLQMARENARQSREQISGPMWSQLNRAYLQLEASKMLDIWPHKMSDFYTDVMNSSYLFYSLADNTLYKGEGFGFLQLGRFLERLQQIVSLLETHIKFIIGWKEGEKELISLLLYCDAFGFYRQVYTLDMKLSNVIQLLLSHPEVPCSLYFSVNQIEQMLKRIDPKSSTYPFNKVYKSVRSLQTTIAHKPMEGTLAEFLEDIRTQSQNIHNDIVSFYFQHSI